MESKPKTKESPLLNTYNLECDLLNLPAIPNFGIYKSDYCLMEPLFILKKTKIPNNLPPMVLKQIKFLVNEYNNISPEFFHITLNATPVYNLLSERKIKTNFGRVNFASHPYLYYGKNIKNISQFDIYTAVYTEKDELDTIKDSKENDGLRINPNVNITHGGLKREVIIHSSQDNLPALSPNNCSILINFNSQVINFYVILLGVRKNTITKCFVGNYIILPNGSNSNLLSDFCQNFLDLDNNFEKLTNQLFLTQMAYNDSFLSVINYYINEMITKGKNIESIKEFLKKGFKIIFDFNSEENDNNSYEIDLNNLSKYYFDNLLHFINFIFPSSQNIENFSEDFLVNNLKNQYIIEIVQKYIDFHLSRINRIINSYIDYFSIENLNLSKIKQTSLDIHKNQKWPILKEFYCSFMDITIKDFDQVIFNYTDKNRKKIENKNIEMFQGICEKILNQEKIEKSTFNEVDEPIKKYFFYYVWEYKGCINGIHGDFGILSFIQSPEIESVYHCNNDERYEVCEAFQQILTQADAKY